MRTIKFAGYDGKFPNYCSGRLSLLVDGRLWERDHCLSHTFGFYFNKNWSEVYYDGVWTLNEGFFEEFTEEERTRIAELVNEHVETGCCGGCV